ncbi:MAG: zinc metalloprotease HtpX [Deltaproteobacteria bacterium]
MFSLNFRMGLLLTALFAVVYAIVVVIGTYMGITDFYFYLVLSIGIMLLQYAISPLLVQWSMRVRYVTRQEAPELYEMVESLARQAKLPMPKVGIAQIPIPNAFAFGRGVRDGRICVTEGILRLLNKDELKAVLGHEMSHLKNRDVVTIMLLSVIPMVMWRIAWNFMFYRSRRDERGGGNLFLIGLLAMIFYFITNLLVLYASRIREYFADKGSVALGSRPSDLASALYKLVYGSARLDKETVKEYQGLKAFFASDPSQAWNEIRELKGLDIDKDGLIDANDLLALRNKRVKLGVGDRLLEAFSTHPNMLKRIKQLSEYRSA